jgi:Uma2 family endonuclease
MVQLQPTSATPVSYPDCDGNPMADNTEQFRWIVVLQQNLEWLFADHPTVFVAGDLLWYPIEGDNKTRSAPDVMVVLGRPKGYRGSYKQWLEGGIAPQVVFEILSPGNTKVEMNRKLLFYDRHGVQEYYLYDPTQNVLSGWLRGEDYLDVIDPIANWVSPRLGIRFDISGPELQVYRPDGNRFLSYVEIAQQLQQANQRIEQAETQATHAEDRATQAELLATRLAEQLRALGVDPDQV